MRFDNLHDWLTWQETLNPAEIDLGLERVASVLSQAGLSSSFRCPLITVAGTNGKGSVVAMLEAMAMAAGLKVCSYTSPHLFQYNERIRINGLPVNDDDLCRAFEFIDQTREDTPLTYFEFGTLAAIYLFFGQQPDLVILEVGLGGRLDAVNVMDADVSILTSIAIDHVDWLGDDRESIGYEKAGVFRPGRAVICGDASPPASVVQYARKLRCEFIQAGRDFTVPDSVSHSNKKQNGWSLKSCFGDMELLPEPVLTGEFQKSNAATAVVALQVLIKTQKITLQMNQLVRGAGLKGNNTDLLQQAVITGLKSTVLAGRFQQLKAEPQVIVDVAHNPQAALALNNQLQQLPGSAPSRTWAIVAMLSDKDISGVIDNMNSAIDTWCFAGLENISRGLDVRELVKRLPAVIDLPDNMAEEFGHELAENQCKILSDRVLLASTVTDACQLVLSKANRNDRVIIFGSFYTVTEAIQFFSG